MNTSANEDIIFDKQMDVNTDSNVWDDEALIRMYDKTTAMAYDKIQKRDKNSKTSTRAGKSANDVSTSKNSGGKVWKVGDTCMAMYDEDEKCYPAKILSVDPSKDKYEVVYTEYNENAVLSYDKLFRGYSASIFDAHDDIIASKRRRLNNISSKRVSSSNTIALSSSSSGESWRKSSSVSTPTSTWKMPLSSESPWHSSSQERTTSFNPELSSSSKGTSAEYSSRAADFQHTWNKCRVTTVDYISTAVAEQNLESISHDGQLTGADLYVLLNAGYSPEILNEIVQNRLLKAGYNVKDVDSHTSGGDAHEKCLLLMKSSNRESSCEPQEKRAKTYLPPLVNAPLPSEMSISSTVPLEANSTYYTMANEIEEQRLPDTFIKSKKSNKMSERNAKSGANLFKTKTYSAYDDYALFDPVAKISANTGHLRAKTFRQTLEQTELELINKTKHFLRNKPASHKHYEKIRHESHQKQEMNYETVQEKSSNIVQDGSKMELQQVFFPTSEYPPEYSRKQLSEVSCLSILAAKKYASENQPKFANMKEVFDCRITNVVQQIADSCVGSLNRALYINGADVADKHDKIVFTEVTKTVKRFVTLSTKRSENCPPPVGLKALEHGASAFKIYCEEIHERLRQLPDGKARNNESFDLSDDEVEWTDEDHGLEDGEKASVSVLNNGKQETFPIPDLCPPPPPALFGKIAQAGNNKEALTNMLMSWYMSGYHTGYYQGMQQAKAGNSSTAVTAKRTNANR